MPRAFFVLLAVTCFGALSCGEEPSERSPDEVLSPANARGAYGAGVTTIDLVDTSRPTAANNDYPGSDERTLVTDIWYPTDVPTTEEPARDAAVSEDGAPYPLIVLSHGLSATRALYASYAEQLASHGYVVAAPDYPLSNIAAPGGPRLRAVIEQPEDLSFVIDQMLTFNEEEGHLLASAVNPERIGATGHSLGAMTTFMSVYGPDRDGRIDAALPFAIPGCFFPASYVADISVPILFAVGTNDLITPPISTEHAFGIAKSPSFAVTISGADHTRFADVDISDQAIVGQNVLEGIGQGSFLSDATELGQHFQGDLDACGLGAEPPDQSLLDAARQREILRAIQVVFFDAYLRDDEASLGLIEQLDQFVPEVTIQSDTD